jgi:hypothetical protein
LRNCGEERPAQLGYFHSPEFDHVRIEACDTCKHYIKGVDLTRVGSIGFGAGLLLAGKFKRGERKMLGWTLFLSGLAGTIPIAIGVFRKKGGKRC